MDKKELRILGISAGHTNASYTLILEEVNGNRKLPIVIGSAEAQSIAVQMESITPVRPMTHDLFKAVLKSQNIKIPEIIIARLFEGIFYSEIIILGETGPVSIDARTSDAVAIALRFNSPIFTYESILEEAGIILTDVENEQIGKNSESEIEEEEFDEKDDDLENEEELIHADDFSEYSIEELTELLHQAIEDENYDEAALIRDEINKRKNSENPLS